MEPINNQEIQEILENSIENSQVIVNGDGYKYETTVISDSFQGQTTLKRHKLIYSVLNGPITDGRLHALTVKTYTPEEWEKMNS